jgi:L-fuconolactonase
LIVDAHHHFWNPTRIPQPWMTEEHDAINRAFEPADLEPLVRENDVIATVLVQSAAQDRDTDYMFEQIDGVSWIGAVVAWLRLDDAEAARNRLRELQAQPKLRGIRHLIHQELDPHWILGPSIQCALELLAEADVLLELPAEFPKHLEDVPELARRHPELTLVIDHLAKPPLGSEEMARWREQVLAAAAHPNVYAKVSGLNTKVAARDWTPADLEPAIETALQAFGPQRLVFGSDWPVALLNGTYGDVVGRTCDAIRAVTGSNTDAVLADNAMKLYRIAE